MGNADGCPLGNAGVLGNVAVDCPLLRTGAMENFAADYPLVRTVGASVTVAVDLGSSASMENVAGEPSSLVPWEFFGRPRCFHDCSMNHSRCLTAFQHVHVRLSRRC